MSQVKTWPHDSDLQFEMWQSLNDVEFRSLQLLLWQGISDMGTSEFDIKITGRGSKDLQFNRFNILNYYIWKT